MNLYGIFLGSKWSLGRNKREALKLAKAQHGYVMVLRNAFGYGNNMAWDAPTFRVTADMLADFRPSPFHPDKDAVDPYNRL